MTTETSLEYSRQYRKKNLDRCRTWGREYFRRHSARIASERAEKMKNSDHAEAVREYYREYWRKRATGEHIPYSPPLYHEFDGQKERVYRTSEAARMLFCATATIFQWHKKGWLPDPLMVRDRRLYRRYQIDLLGLLLSIRKRDSNTRAKLLKFISENW